MAEQKKSKPTCYECGAELIFSNDMRGKNGKMIPLDPSTKEPHTCQEVKEEPKKSFDEVSRNVEKEAQKADTVVVNETLARKETEYVDHTLARPSEVKIFYADNRSDVEKDYKDFQIGKRFNWTRAQYQPIVVKEVVIFSIALYYELAK